MCNKWLQGAGVGVVVEVAEAEVDAMGKINGNAFSDIGKLKRGRRSDRIGDSASRPLSVQ